MNRILVASKISVMDFSLNVQRSPDPSLLWARTAGGRFYSGTHYSVAGYALLAESIAAEFSKENV